MGLPGHQTRRGDQARFVSGQRADRHAHHAALMRRASLSTPMEARTSCGRSHWLPLILGRRAGLDSTGRVMQLSWRIAQRFGVSLDA
jgi:hypothetical protein